MAGPEFDPVASVNELGPYYQYSLNVPMYANVLVAGAECIDWMMEHKDVPLVGFLACISIKRLPRVGKMPSWA